MSTKPPKADLEKLAGLADDVSDFNWAVEDFDYSALLKVLDQAGDGQSVSVPGQTVFPVAPGAATVVYSESNPGGAIFSVRMGGSIRYQVRANSLFELLQEGGSAPPLPPPPTVTIASVSAPSPVLVGATVNVVVTLSGPAATATAVTLSSSSAAVLAGPGSVIIPAQATQAQTPYQARAPGTVTVTAALVASSAQVSVTVSSSPPPPPPPGPVANVRDFGAKGDGTTDDSAACQAAIHSFGVTPLGSGPHVVYFPAGRYLMSRRKLQIVGQHDIHLLGDDPNTSIVIARGIDGVQIGAQQNCAVRKLGFEGIIGRTHKDGGNDGHAITLEGAKNTLIEDIISRWSGMGVAAFAGAVGATLTNVQVRGWATVGFFLGAGWKMHNCHAIQEDANLFGQRTGHGVYIPSAASDLDIDGLTINGARIYAMQIYGEVQGSVQRNISIRNLEVTNCNAGLTFARETGAAELVNLTLDGFRITGTYNGHGIHAKKASRSVIRNGVISDQPGESAGLHLGGWAPYEPGQTIADLLIQNVAIERCQKGLWIMQSNGGHLTNVRIENSSLVRNNRVGNVLIEPWHDVMPDDVKVT